VAVNNSARRTESQFGALPINNSSLRLLISGFYVDDRQSGMQGLFDLRHQRTSLGFEPQLQLHLGQGTDLNFRSATYWRENPNVMDTLFDATLNRRNDFLVRLELGATNLAASNGSSPSGFLTATPFYRFTFIKIG
jgi:hypothetical protein